VVVARKAGATNALPFFVTANGPVMEARFKFHRDGTRDGGVQALFTIKGRSDAAGCNLAQPDFNAADTSGNLALRIPTPLFGLGLVEAIDDATIRANQKANLNAKRQLGIGGRPTLSGNDGTITRFGWKAQNPSLEMFSGEAYNVEQGVTNDLFMQERAQTEGCMFNPAPESSIDMGGAESFDIISDVQLFAAFMRFLAPPTAVAGDASVARGRDLFGKIGCALCHTPSLQTGEIVGAALSGRQARLYSDLLLHHMGVGLADDIEQGLAKGDEFRTAPLWGLGQRLFFLHDRPHRRPAAGDRRARQRGRQALSAVGGEPRHRPLQQAVAGAEAGPPELPAQPVRGVSASPRHRRIETGCRPLPPADSSGRRPRVPAVTAPRRLWPSP
jgi:mono/diheme cytochrome c family protein